MTNPLLGSCVIISVPASLSSTMNFSGVAVRLNMGIPGLTGVDNVMLFAHDTEVNQNMIVHNFVLFNTFCGQRKTAQVQNQLMKFPYNVDVFR